MKGKKTGGRQKGTPNKDNPLKGWLRSHSENYFMPTEKVIDGEKVNVSDFDMDLAALAPDDRVNAELRLLEFHSPKVKAVDVDMNVKCPAFTLEDRLRELFGEDEED